MVAGIWKPFLTLFVGAVAVSLCLAGTSWVPWVRLDTSGERLVVTEGGTFHSLEQTLPLALHGSCNLRVFS